MRISVKFGSHLSFSAIALLLVVAIASLAWIYRQRLDEFHSYHGSFATGTAAEIASQVSFLLQERQRQVGLFAEDHRALLEQLVAKPEDSRLHDAVGARLRRAFPDHFAFVLTTPRGEPYWTDFDGYIGGVCVQDIQRFATSGRNDPRIHPNPVEYHYDVMARWQSAAQPDRILMVSFKPDQLVRRLRAVKAPGHELMLVVGDGSNLIEVTAQGPRTALKREDFRLDAAELGRIVHRRDIPDSRWQIVDLFEPGFVEGYRRELFADMAVFLAVFLAVAGASFALIRREEQARQRAEEAREEIFSAVTHDLRTPLTSIVGSLGLLASGALGALPEKARELVDIMNRSSASLRRLIDDLLDSRRIEAGKLELDLQPVELGALVDEALKRNAAYASGLEVRFERSGARDPAWVIGDPIRLHQVMANLLSNAAKFAPAGTAVEASVATSNSGRARVSVVDRGPGISREFRTRIFGRFAQDKGGGGKAVASSGLGLSIVKTLVELHGGEVGFDSVTGGGTTFFFELPVTPAPQASANA